MVMEVMRVLRGEARSTSPTEQFLRAKNILLLPHLPHSSSSSNLFQATLSPRTYLRSLGYSCARSWEHILNTIAFYSWLTLAIYHWLGRRAFFSLSDRTKKTKMSSHGGEHIASDSTNEYVVDNSSGTDDESILFITTPARRAGYERDLIRARESVPYKSQQQPEGGFDAYSGQLNRNSPAFPNAGFIPRGLYRPFHPMRNTGGLRIITPRELANLPVNDVAWTKSDGQIIEVSIFLLSP